MDGTEFLWFYLLNNIGMKKFIIALLAAMILVPSMADAQIKTLGNFRVGQVKLNHANDGYYLILKSDNTWLDTSRNLHLGFNKEEALKLLDRMMEIHVEGIPFSFNDAYGNRFYYSNHKHSATIHFDGWYGTSEIGKSELKRIKAKIEKHK